jgi:hypothetical protein
VADRAEVGAAVALGAEEDSADLAAARRAAVGRAEAGSAGGRVKWKKI